MFISLDLETTGFNSEKDKIIEFGAIKFDLKGNQETLSFLINPETEIPEIVTHITGIENKDVKNAAVFTEKQQEIQNFLENFPIIGHNIQFDTGFLKENGITVKGPEYDTHPLSKMLFPHAQSHSLEVLSQLLGLKHENKHRALDDAIAAMKLFKKLIAQFTSLSKETIQKIHKICKKTDWPLKILLLDLHHNPKAKKISLKPKMPHNTNPEDQSKIIEKISKEKKSSLVEYTKPFSQLILELSKKLKKDDYLAISKFELNKITNQLPENIAQLDLPENYISLSRLNEFKNKQHLTNSETTALIKTILWELETKSGLISTLNLFREEKEILSQITIDENISILEKELYFQKARKKDQKSPAVCTYQYLQNTDIKAKKLIIIDFEKLSKNILRHSSTKLNIEYFTAPLISLLKQFPDHEDLKQIFNSSTILFGLIGMIFEKNNDQNIYGPKAIISNLELHSKEWLDIKNGIKRLIEISKKLIKLKGKNISALKSWKKSLQKIYNIFFHPELEKNLILIEKDFNDKPQILKIPKSINSEIEKSLKKAEKYMLIDENICLCDEGEFLKKHFNLDTELKISEKSKKNPDLEINIHSNFPHKPYEAEERLLQDLSSIPEGKTVIICNSLKNLKTLTLKAKKQLEGLGLEIISQLTGSYGKLASKFKEAPEKSLIILTPNTWQKLEDEGIYQYINKIYIQKIPFSPPSDPFLTAKTDKYSNSFIEYQIPEAIINLLKIIKRIPKKHEAKINLLDSRIIDKKYGKQILKKLKETGEVNII